MVTFINTKGMAFFGPGSEWFWAALQFTALADHLRRDLPPAPDCSERERGRAGR